MPKHRPKPVSSQPRQDDSGLKRPLFSVRHLNMRVSVKKCDDKIFREFTKRLVALSERTWNEINSSDKHQYGFERISRSQIKPAKSIPEAFNDVKKFPVFRAAGDNHAFVCYIADGVIYPIFIEANFGDVYHST